MRINHIITLAITLYTLSISSQEMDWATQVTGDRYQYGIKYIKDSSGNTYFIGHSQSSTFEYDNESYPTIGAGDAFFGKLNSGRDLVFIKAIGANDTTYTDEILDIHIDSFGDIYMSLISNGNDLTYDNQILSGINTNSGRNLKRAILLKTNSLGEYLWHKTGSSNSSFQALTSDSNGNLYLTGSFKSSEFLLNGQVILSNPSTGTTVDLLLVKCTRDGTLLWAKNAGGLPHNTFARGYDIEINPETNELIVLGYGDGEVFFDDVPMPLFENSNTGSLLISYNLDGTQNWIKRILDLPFSSQKLCNSLDISSTGVIATSGSLTGTNPNGLVGFYTEDGMVISEKRYPSSNSLKINSIIFNEFDDAYITGNFITDAILGIDSETTLLSNGHNGFVAKLDINQQIKWTTQFEASNFESSITYQNGKVFYAGRFDGQFNYNNNQEFFINNAGDAVFGEIVDYELAYNGSEIKGTVFQDLNTDCILNSNEIKQKSIIIKATDDNNVNYYSITDVNGNYQMRVNPGEYTVQILPNPLQRDILQQNCYSEQVVLINQVGQDAINIDFPLEIINCPLLVVDINSDRRRRCFQNNTYVQYSNLGFSDSDNATVIVKFPEYVTFISSDHTYSIDTEGRYLFEVGSLSQNETGVIKIIDTVECLNGITGLTQCTQAWITPANDCVISSDSDYDVWDKSSVQVSGKCYDGSIVQFKITNTGEFGNGDMQNFQEYRIYVDNQLAITETFKLQGGESIIIEYPANGRTIRLEADQHPNHPGNSRPQSTIENCGTSNEDNSNGLVNTMAMDDLDVNTEIHCLEIIDSYDPNDKSVSPLGITENFNITAGTVLEYMIRFQNTGSDTAYKVVIKDTISANLDPASIEWGISSHQYTVNVSGIDRPIIEFTFDEINLPHQAVDELGSNGFVKFKIATFGTLQNGNEIKNNTHIFFDFNLPILTNTTKNIISDYVPLYTQLSNKNELYEKVEIYPNPTTGVVIIKNVNLKYVEVYNIHGQLLCSTNINEIDLTNYSKGIYLLKVISTNGYQIKKIILK